MFETAAKRKFTYRFKNGTINTEDLFTLNLDRLNDVAKTIYKAIKEGEHISFLETGSVITKTNNDRKLDLVKHIIKSKQRDLELSEDGKVKDAEKILLLQALAQKQAEKMASLSADELQDKINKLG